MTPVALLSSSSYEPRAVSEALTEALGLLGGLDAHIHSGDRVLVKPNLLTGQPPENAATTHPAVLEALLQQLVDLGARPCIGDSPAFGWVAKVAEACGVAEVARKYGAPIVEFASPVSIESVRPRVRRRFTVEKTLLDVNAVINVPKLKSHRQLGFTGATKNLYGCMPGKRKAYFHMERGNHDSDFARLVASFAYSLPTTLHLLDGIVAMERDGPQSGDPKPLGAMIVSKDAAAVDAVAAELIRAPGAGTGLARDG
jgi:uncharacterized protein (DUF362 family)